MGKPHRVKRRSRRSRRRFTGNQFTREESTTTTSPPQEKQLMNDVEPVIETLKKTASSSKIEAIETDTSRKTDEFIIGYRFVDMEILSSIVSMLCCPKCKSCTLKLHETFDQKKGCVSLLNINCEEMKMKNTSQTKTHNQKKNSQNCCKFKEEFYTSSPVGKSYNINRRIIYAMRSIGQGHVRHDKIYCLD